MTFIISVVLTKLMNIFKIGLKRYLVLKSVINLKKNFVLIIFLLWISGVLVKNVGVTGGEVRHAEIGKDSNLIRINIEEDD